MSKIDNTVLKSELEKNEQFCIALKTLINIGSDNTDYPTATSVTNYEFEEKRQDSLRKIRLLKPEFIDSFVNEFRSLMKESIV